jgi:hypothetical protein
MDLEDDGVSEATVPDPGSTVRALDGCMWAVVGSTWAITGILIVVLVFCRSLDDAGDYPDMGMAASVSVALGGALMAVLGSALCVCLALRLCCWYSSDFIDSLHDGLLHV